MCVNKTRTGAKSAYPRFREAFIHFRSRSSSEVIPSTLSSLPTHARTSPPTHARTPTHALVYLRTHARTNPRTLSNLYLLNSTNSTYSTLSALCSVRTHGICTTTRSGVSTYLPLRREMGPAEEEEEEEEEEEFLPAEPAVRFSSVRASFVHISSASDSRRTVFAPPRASNTYIFSPNGC